MTVDAATRSAESKRERALHSLCVVQRAPHARLRLHLLHKLAAGEHEHQMQRDAGAPDACLLHEVHTQALVRLLQVMQLHIVLALAVAHTHTHAHTRAHAHAHTHAHTRTHTLYSLS